MGITIKPAIPAAPVAKLKENGNPYMNELGFAGSFLDAATKAVSEQQQNKAVATPSPKEDLLKASPSVGTVETTHLKNDYGKKTILSTTKEQENMHSPAIPLDQLCNLNVGGKMTLNLGNYESAQIHCSLTLPCTRDTLEDAYEFASNWVSNKIETAVAAAKKGA